MMEQQIVGVVVLGVAVAFGAALVRRTWPACPWDVILLGMSALQFLLYFTVQWASDPYQAMTTITLGIVGTMLAAAVAKVAALVAHDRELQERGEPTCPHLLHPLAAALVSFFVLTFVMMGLMYLVDRAGPMIEAYAQSLAADEVGPFMEVAAMVTVGLTGVAVVAMYGGPLVVGLVQWARRRRARARYESQVEAWQRRIDAERQDAATAALASAPQPVSSS